MNVANLITVLRFPLLVLIVLLLLPILMHFCHIFSNVKQFACPA